VLHFVAICCSVLHCTYNDSQCVAVCCSVLWCVAVCCRMLQCVEFHIQYFNDVSGQRWWSEDGYNFSVLQCVAVRCRMLQCVAFLFQCLTVCCSVLQCIALCCSVLQCVALCCISCTMFHQRGWTALAVWRRVRFLESSVCRVLQGVVGCCRVLQCAAVCCSVMQCDAVCCISHTIFHQRGRTS